MANPTLQSREEVTEESKKSGLTPQQSGGPVRTKADATADPAPATRAEPKKSAQSSRGRRKKSDKPGRPRRQTTNQRFDQVDKRLDRVEKLVQEHKEATNQRFDQTDKRLDRMDQRFDRMDQRFEKIDGRLGEIDKHLVKLDGRLDAEVELNKVHREEMNKRFDLQEKHSQEHRDQIRSSIKWGVGIIVTVMLRLAGLGLIF